MSRGRASSDADEPGYKELLASMQESQDRRRGIDPYKLGSPDGPAWTALQGGAVPAGVQRNANQFTRARGFGSEMLDQGTPDGNALASREHVKALTKEMRSRARRSRQSGVDWVRSFALSVLRGNGNPDDLNETLREWANIPTAELQHNIEKADSPFAKLILEMRELRLLNDWVDADWVRPSEPSPADRSVTDALAELHAATAGAREALGDTDSTAVDLSLASDIAGMLADMAARYSPAERTEKCREMVTGIIRELRLRERYPDFDQENFLTELANVPHDTFAQLIDQMGAHGEVFLHLRAYGYLDGWKDPNYTRAEWVVPGLGQQTDSDNDSSEVAPDARARRAIEERRAAHEPRDYEQRACGNCFKELSGYLEDTSLSRNDNRTYICNQCGEREAMSDLSTSMVEPSITQPLRISSVMVANSNQLRRLAGNSHRFGLPFGMDFRLDTVIAQNGLHVLRVEAMDVEEAIITADCMIKVAHLGPEQPIEGILLSVRLRDWLRLQPPNPLEAERLGASAEQVMVKTRNVIPDEWVPVMPDDPLQRGVMARAATERSVGTMHRKGRK